MQKVMASLLSVLSLLSYFSNALASSAALDRYLATDGVIYADEPTLKAAFDGPRNYTVLMLMTSESGKVDCQFCRVLGPDFRAVATSYDRQIQRSQAPRDLYFVVADPVNVLETFKMLGLSHVPNVVVYAPTKSKSEAKQGIKGPHTFMSFLSTGDQRAYLVSQLVKMGFDIKYEKPLNVAKIGKALLTLLFASSAGFFFRDIVVKIWQAKQIWLAFSLMCVIMFISGHMYNVTRGTPFMSFDGTSLRPIEASFGSQVAAETQILAVVYALLAFTTIGLIKFVPRLDTVWTQTVGAIFGAVVVLGVYSVLLEIFKIKMAGFPMWLLPIKLF